MQSNRTTTYISAVAGHVPQILIEALCRRADAGELGDIHFHHSYTEGPAMYSDPKYQGVFFD